jgi:hypothetical protein
MKARHFFWGLAMLLLSEGTKAMAQQSIRFQYLSLPDKPYHTFVFYSTDDIDTTNEDFFVHKYTVGQEMVSKIALLIMRKDFRPVGRQFKDVYEFVITSKDGEMKFETASLVHMESIFSGVLQITASTKDHTWAKAYFDETIRRLSFR